MHAAALIATLVLQCHLVSAQRVVIADIFRPVDGPTQANLTARQDPFGAQLIQKPDKSMYWINVTVGTPGQPQSLQLDTGSRRMWIPAKGSSLCSSLVDCATLGSFDSSRSSTFDDTGNSDTISYSDGTSVSGEQFYDTVRIGGQAVTHQIGLLGTSGNGLSQGVLGVGFPKTAPTINHNLAAQGIISSNKYSLWLNDVDAAGGTILFGGIDVSKFVRPLIRLPVSGTRNSDGSTSYDQPIVRLTRVATLQGAVPTVQTSSSYSENVVLDTGTSLTVLPKPLADKIIDAVGAQYYPSDATSGTTIIPCSQANDDLSINFHFGAVLTGPTINVGISQMVLQSLGSLNGIEMCQFGIYTSDGSYPTTLGESFLRSAYVLYDLDNNHIGLAQTIVNSGVAKIVELPESGLVPGITA